MIKNKKALAKNIAVIIITSIILFLFINQVLRADDAFDEAWKNWHACEQFPITKGFCVAQYLSCDDYFSYDATILNYTCYKEGDESTKNLKCCIPKGNPVNNIYVEITNSETGDELLLQDGINLPIGSYHFFVKKIPDYYFDVTEVRLVIAGDCVTSVANSGSKAYGSEDKENHHYYFNDFLPSFKNPEDVSLFCRLKFTGNDVSVNPPIEFTKEISFNIVASS